MTLINEFQNIHANSDIYILCSGKSCDYVPSDFLENKICIGINQVYKKKKDCNYYVRKEVQLIGETIKNINPKSYLFVTNGTCGLCNEENKKFVAKYHKNNKKIICLLHYKNVGDKIEEITPEKFNVSDNKLICTSSTITTGIHLAFYMGAKNIILIGHDCCTIDGKLNFDGYHTETSLSFAWGKSSAIKKYSNWVSKVDRMTNHIKNILKDNYNVNILSINPFISIQYLINHIP